MERINTNVEQIVVEIDGEEYPVAAKTVAVADQLAAAQRRYNGKPEYQLWLAELEVLLGKETVKRLFVSGSAENIDRIQMIYAGVCRAFDHNAVNIEAEDAERKAETVASMARAMGPINELLRQLQRYQQPGDNVQMIRRPR